MSNIIYISNDEAVKIFNRVYNSGRKVSVQWTKVNGEKRTAVCKKDAKMFSAITGTHPISEAVKAEYLTVLENTSERNALGQWKTNEPKWVRIRKATIYAIKADHKHYVVPQTNAECKEALEQFRIQEMSV